MSERIRAWMTYYSREDEPRRRDWASENGLRVVSNALGSIIAKGHASHHPENTIGSSIVFYVKRKPTT